MAAALTPQVFWAQRHPEIYLRVEVADAKDVKVSLKENTFLFSAQGSGAQGENQYEFSLEFLKPVKNEIYKKSDQRQVTIKINKQEAGWWERLTLQEEKPAFLSPDNSRWKEQALAEKEIIEKKAKAMINDIIVESKVRENPTLALKKAYMFLYNLVQFLGFAGNFVHMTSSLFVQGEGSLAEAYNSSVGTMDFCQALAVLEAVNPLLGIGKSSFTPEMLQLVSRNVVLFIVFRGLHQMQRKPIVFFVFFLWSVNGTLKHPVNMLSSLGIDYKSLTWLKHNLGMVLYPAEVAAEVMAVVQSLPIFDETGVYSLPIPMELGSPISFAYTLFFYLVLLLSGFYLNMKELYKQRMRQFRVKKAKSQ